MTTKRIVQLRSHPLTHGELINALSIKNPVYCEEEDAFLGLSIIIILFIEYHFHTIFLVAWLAKTPIYRKKQRAHELELQKLEEAEEKKKRKGRK